MGAASFVKCPLICSFFVNVDHKFRASRKAVHFIGLFLKFPAVLLLHAALSSSFDLLFFFFFLQSYVVVVFDAFFPFVVVAFFSFFFFLFFFSFFLYILLLFVAFRVQELSEGRCGCLGLPIPNSPCDLCGRKATLNYNKIRGRSSEAV